MTYCSESGECVPYLGGEGYAPGFSPETIYRTYDEYVNDSERYFIEYFLRDAYEYYGYGLRYYDGAPVDMDRAVELINDFSTVNHYIRETWWNIFAEAEVTQDGNRVDSKIEEQVQKQLLENYMEGIRKNRILNTHVLLKGLRFVNKDGQPLRMMPMLEPDPELLENPIYH